MGKPKAAAAETPSAPPLNLPEGLPEADWREGVETAAGQDVAEAVVAEVVDATLDRYHEYLLSQLAKPFTANRCTEMLSAMIEVAFLPHDQGEPGFADDELWAAGDEPVPCPRDSWSRGTVPVRKSRRSAAAAAKPVEPPTAQVATAANATKVEVVAADPPAARPLVAAAAAAAPAAPTPPKGARGSRSRANGRLKPKPKRISPLNGAPAAVAAALAPAAGPVGPVGAQGGGAQTRRRSSLTETMDARNQQERSSLTTAKAASGAAKVSYRTSGIIPVVGVRGDKLPRNSVVAAVSVEPGSGKLKAKGVRPSASRADVSRRTSGGRLSKSLGKASGAKKAPPQVSA